MIKKFTTWNIYTKNSDKNVAEGLNAIKKKDDPVVIGTQESVNYGKPLSGYTRVQHDSKSYGYAAETANIAIYVRKDYQILKTWSLRSKRNWRGPHGKMHDPRVDRGVLIKKKGERAIKVGVFHGPWTPSNTDLIKKEFFTKVKNFARFTVPGRPVVLLMDANVRGATMERQTGLKAYFIGVDGFLLKNCKGTHLVKYRDKYGSDSHAPMTLEVNL